MNEMIYIKTKRRLFFFLSGLLMITRPNKKRTRLPGALLAPLSYADTNLRVYPLIDDAECCRKVIV